MSLPPPALLAQTMRLAAAEARKWLGATSPNPPVGAAALAADGRVLAVAAHHRAGEAHAETALLHMLRKGDGVMERAATADGTVNTPSPSISRIDTLCVTLEPCNHHGLTPPCTEAIIAAGIRRVVIGTRDPNPHVTGGGIERLQAAGVDVITGVAEDECRQLIHAFAYKAQTGKAFVTVKRAFRRSDGDGVMEGTALSLGTVGTPSPPPESMIPPAGQKTFTSASSLCLAHRLRKKADAILTGSGTILADNPLFTVRHVQDHPNKRRWLAILDRRGRVPQAYIDAAKTRGLDAVIYRDIETALSDLAAKGAQDVLVEAGPALAQNLLDLGLWAMSVTIRQAETDRIDVAFNPRETLPFDANHFGWDTVLPEECLSSPLEGEEVKT